MVDEQFEAPIDQPKANQGAPINAAKFRQDMEELAAGVQEIEPRTWQADTPEQALAWLRLNFYYPATVAAKVETDAGPQMQLVQRAFFRGHAVASWRPAPTLFREPEDKQRHELAVTNLAASIIDVEFQMLWSADGTQGWPPLDKRSGHAASQHYGFLTTILDWTLNPSVAVHFATCSKSSPTSSGACVLWISAADALEMSLNAILPPVYISRLYRQRGLFTEMTPDLVEEVERRQYKILFPAQPSVPALLTDGKHTIEAELLPAEPWFDELRKWADSNAHDERFIAAPVMAHMVFTKKHGNHPAFSNYNELVALFSVGGHSSEMLAFIRELGRRATRDGYCYDPRMLDLVEAANGPLLDWFRRQGETFPRCGG